MPAATILFSDIVGFSKKPTAEQRRLVNAFTGEVKQELEQVGGLQLDSTGVLALPTGDGVILAFVHGAERVWHLSHIMGLLLRLQRWAFKETSSSESVSLRFGIHLGAVEFVRDINGRINASGDTVNFTQRVMDAANPRQVLFSEAAFREYIGSENPHFTTPPFSEEMKGEFLGPIAVEAKHGLRIPVYKLALNPKQGFWCNDDPISKGAIAVKAAAAPESAAVLRAKAGSIDTSDVEITNASVTSMAEAPRHIETDVDIQGDISGSKVRIDNLKQKKV